MTTTPKTAATAGTPTDPMEAVYVARRAAAAKAEEAKKRKKEAEAEEKAALGLVAQSDALLIPVIQRAGKPQTWAGDLVYTETETVEQRAACGPKDLIKLVLQRDPAEGLRVQDDYDSELSRQRKDHADNPKTKTVLAAKPLAQP